MNTQQPDFERRFGGLNRLYGATAPDVLARARVAVAGIGGVGSWSAEALARCGIGALTLIDMDHVAESNINRQIHALGATLGQAKIEAMAARIRDINPACRLTLVDDFVSPDNIDSLFADSPPDFLIDATDQAAAKIAMILWARRQRCGLLVCGGAGGKTDPLALRSGDLAASVNDALLSKLRQRLRKEHGYPGGGTAAGRAGKRVPKMGVSALWFDQQALLPDAWAQSSSPAQGPQGLSCAGYGSVVMVTAAMGMAAADRAVKAVLAAALSKP